ncbi:MAG: helix-turn-helix domain-containing protein [Bacteroidota bacterium]
MLRFNRTEPSPELRQFIQGYWQIENGAQTEILDLVPDGHPELVFLLSNKVITKPHGLIGVQVPTAGFIGQLTKRFITVLEPHAKLFFVKLYPWTPFLLFQVPQFQLNDKITELEALTDDPLLRHLPCLIRSCDKLDSLKENLDRLFIDKLNAESFDHPFLQFAVSRIFATNGTISVDSLRNNIAASRRYVEKLFKKNIGLTPKQFARLIRVKKASIFLQQKDFSGQLSSVSASLNYYDQSHFLKDFKMVVGSTPTQFLSQQSNLKIDGLESYLAQWDYS